MADQPTNPFALLMQPVDNPQETIPASEVIPDQNNHRSKVIVGDDLPMPPSEEDAPVVNKSDKQEDRSVDDSDVDEEMRRIDRMIQDIFLITIDHGKTFVHRSKYINFSKCCATVSIQ